MVSEQHGSAFGVLLKRQREAAGLTQEALAERASISARGISDLERGINRAPRPVTLRLLARALSLDATAEQQLETAARRLAGPMAPEAIPILVGREREMALLDRHLHGKGSPLLLLAGQPGFGKTRLLQEAARVAARLGWAVVSGGCTRAGGQQPFAPLLQAVHAHLAGRSAAERQADLRGCAWLVRMLPELAADQIEPLPGWTLSLEQERRLLFVAVGRLLRNVAGPAGTLLLLDDLQWAGSDALDLVATLLRHAPAAALRIVGTYRDTDVAPEHPLMLTLAELAEAQLAAQRPLPPLADHDAAALVTQLCGGPARVEAGQVAQVVQRVGGVPFSLVSYARSLEEGGEAVVRQGVPWDLRQSLQRRLRALPDVARSLVDAAAVAGRVTARALLLRLLEEPETAVLDGLEAACRAGLLEEVGEDAYGFVHDVIREVVESGLGQARRALLHRRVAEVLEQQPGEPPVELLAHHYARSGELEQALRYLELAGDRARATAAYEAAEQYYREAVARLDGLGRLLEAARVREKLAEVLGTALRMDAALEVLGQAAAALRGAGDAEGLGRVLAASAHLHIRRFTADSIEAGLACLLPVVAPLEARGRSRSLAAVYAALARLRYFRDEHQAAVATSARAVELARAVGDRALQAEVVARRGVLLSIVGRDAEALPALQEAARLAEAVGKLDTVAFAACQAANIHDNRGEFSRAWSLAAHALALGEQLADPALIASATFRIAALAFFEGDWPGARRALARLEPLQQLPGELAAGPALELGRLCLAEGAWEEATRYLEQCSAITLHVGTFVHAQERVAQSYLAELDLLQGRPATAEARLRRLLDRGEGAEERDVTAYVLPVLAWAQLELGETARAAEVIAQALCRAREAEYRLTLVGALRVHALVALRLDDRSTAAQALDEGLALARALPYPHGEGRLLEAYGHLHLACGEPAATRARLAEAAAIFRRLGARKDLERVEQAPLTLG